MQGTQVDNKKCEVPGCQMLALARVPELIDDLERLNPGDKDIKGFVCQSCINGHNQAVNWSMRVSANNMGVAINGP